MSFLSRLFARPFNADATAAKAAADFKQALGPDFLSVMAFGSWAIGEYIPGHSDLNLLVVARRLDAEVLKKLAGPAQALANPNLSLRYFSQPELKRFSMVFPLEFQDMAETRKLLSGEDIFGRLEVPNANLAFELHSEARIRLLKFRQKLVSGVVVNDAVARELAGSTLSALLPMMRGLLRLKGKKPPKQRVRVIEEACRLFRLSRRTLLQAHDIKYGRKNAGSIDAMGLVERLREELERMADICAGLNEGGDGGQSSAPRDRGEREGREGGREGREGGREREGRDREGGGGRRDHRDRDRERGHKFGGGGGDRNKRLAEVRQLMADAGQKKRWEPAEPARFVSDELSRETGQPLGVRFAWDRAWQPERRKKGYTPPKPVEVEAPAQSEEEAWADEAAEIAAVAAAEQAASGEGSETSEARPAAAEEEPQEASGPEPDGSIQEKA